MFVICNETEYEKKKLKGVPKLIISYDLKKVRENDDINHLTHLIPPYKIMSNYYNDKYSDKKYFKKYVEFLETDEVYATLLTVLMMYEKEDNVALVCSTAEMDFKYLEFLLEFLQDKFNIKFISFSKWKQKDYPKKNPIDKDKLKKEVKKYKNIIFGVDEEPKKKKNKKKKDSIDIEFPEREELKDCVRKIRIKRIKE